MNDKTRDSLVMDFSDAFEKVRESYSESLKMKIEAIKLKREEGEAERPTNVIPFVMRRNKQ